MAGLQKLNQCFFQCTTGNNNTPGTINCQNYGEAAGLWATGAASTCFCECDGNYTGRNCEAPAPHCQGRVVKNLPYRVQDEFDRPRKGNVPGTVCAAYVPGPVCAAPVCHPNAPPDVPHARRCYDVAPLGAPNACNSCQPDGPQLEYPPIRYQLVLPDKSKSAPQPAICCLPALKLVAWTSPAAAPACRKRWKNWITLDAPPSEYIKAYRGLPRAPWWNMAPSQYANAFVAAPGCLFAAKSPKDLESPTYKYDKCRKMAESQQCPAKVALSTTCPVEGTNINWDPPNDGNSCQYDPLAGRLYCESQCNTILADSVQRSGCFNNATKEAFCFDMSSQKSGCLNACTTFHQHFANYGHAPSACSLEQQKENKCPRAPAPAPYYMLPEWHAACQLSAPIAQSKCAWLSTIRMKPFKAPSTYYRVFSAAPGPGHVAPTGEWQTCPPHRPVLWAESGPSVPVKSDPDIYMSDSKNAEATGYCFGTSASNCCQKCPGWSQHVPSARAGESSGEWYNTQDNSCNTCPHYLPVCETITTAPATTSCSSGSAPAGFVAGALPRWAAVCVGDNGKPEPCGDRWAVTPGTLRAPSPDAYFYCSATPETFLYQYLDPEKGVTSAESGALLRTGESKPGGAYFRQGCCRYNPLQPALCTWDPSAVDFRGPRPAPTQQITLQPQALTGPKGPSPLAPYGGFSAPGWPYANVQAVTGSSCQKCSAKGECLACAAAERCDTTIACMQPLAAASADGTCSAAGLAKASPAVFAGFSHRHVAASQIPEHAKCSCLSNYKYRDQKFVFEAPSLPQSCPHVYPVLQQKQNEAGHKVGIGYRGSGTFSSTASTLTQFFLQPEYLIEQPGPASHTQPLLVNKMRDNPNFAHVASTHALQNLRPPPTNVPLGPENPLSYYAQCGLKCQNCAKGGVTGRVMSTMTSATHQAATTTQRDVLPTLPNATMYVPFVVFSRIGVRYLGNALNAWGAPRARVKPAFSEFYQSMNCPQPYPIMSNAAPTGVYFCMSSPAAPGLKPVTSGPKPADKCIIDCDGVLYQKYASGGVPGNPYLGPAVAGPGEMMHLAPQTKSTARDPTLEPCSKWNSHCSYANTYMANKQMIVGASTDDVDTKDNTTLSRYDAAGQQGARSAVGQKAASQLLSWLGRDTTNAEPYTGIRPLSNAFATASCADQVDPQSAGHDTCGCAPGRGNGLCAARENKKRKVNAWCGADPIPDACFGFPAVDPGQIPDDSYGFCSYSELPGHGTNVERMRGKVGQPQVVRPQFNESVPSTCSETVSSKWAAPNARMSPALQLALNCKPGIECRALHFSGLPSCGANTCRWDTAPASALKKLYPHSARKICKKFGGNAECGLNSQ